MHCFQILTVHCNNRSACHSFGTQHAPVRARMHPEERVSEKSFTFERMCPVIHTSAFVVGSPHLDSFHPLPLEDESRTSFPNVIQNTLDEWLQNTSPAYFHRYLLSS